ncbi:unnamed protein product [Thelazia callipaeda]|uniref:Transmembrane protein n=1 Tax=Thelazia callipaeda TaxID=103827 RepID=A0A0N5D9H6_THECL|nr:unnamed protein product [Thelazia callipaeda]
MKKVEEDNFVKDEPCRAILLQTSSTSASSHSPVIAVNMHSSHVIRKSCICYHDSSDADIFDGNYQSGDDYNDAVDTEKIKMQSQTDGHIFQSANHYLQIDRNSINILLKVAAAVVLLCIAGCLVLQHLRINRLDYRIRRFEVDSAFSIQVSIISSYVIFVPLHLYTMHFKAVK